MGNSRVRVEYVISCVRRDADFMGDMKCSTGRISHPFAARKPGDINDSTKFLDFYFFSLLTSTQTYIQNLPFIDSTPFHAIFVIKLKLTPILCF